MSSKTDRGRCRPGGLWARVGSARGDTDGESCRKGTVAAVGLCNCGLAWDRRAAFKNTRPSAGQNEEPSS
eukprot:9496551-Pyramimonas_sp.AAC.1